MSAPVIEQFVYIAHPGRIIFGSGTVAQLPDELEALGITRALLLSTPAQAEQARAIAGSGGGRIAGMFGEAAMHTPVQVTEKAMRIVQDQTIDGVVAFGGGSTTGLGKAIALRSGLPQLVIPTTYAGSEMTPVLGETRDGRKTTQSDPAILPETVIYDVDLTLSLPPSLSATSGINAIAHAVEALYARNRNPIVSLMAQEAVAHLASAIPRITVDPSDKAARTDALYGAWLCGTCLGAVGMALHHKLCHTLGGSFNLPHAETHTVMLPHALAYNLPAAPDAERRLRQALSTGDPALALYKLAHDAGAPVSLRELGMPEAAIDEATDIALSNAYWNPRPLNRDSIRNLIAQAWSGIPPEAYHD